MAHTTSTQAAKLRLAQAIKAEVYLQTTHKDVLPMADIPLPLPERTLVAIQAHLSLRACDLCTNTQECITPPAFTQAEAKGLIFLKLHRAYRFG